MNEHHVNNVSPTSTTSSSDMIFASKENGRIYQYRHPDVQGWVDN